MNEKYCPLHNCDLVYQEWIAKSGKKQGQMCKAWKCPTDKMCKSTIWVDDVKQRVYSPKPTQQEASQIVAMRELYLLIKAVGLSLLSVQAIPPDEAEKLINDNVVMLKNKK